MDIEIPEINRAIGPADSVGLGVKCGGIEDERMSMSSKEMRQGTKPNKLMKEQTINRIVPRINIIKNGFTETNKKKSVVIRFTEETNTEEGEEPKEGEPRNNSILRRAGPMKWLIRLKE